MRKVDLRSTQREAAQTEHISWTYNISSLSGHNGSEILSPPPCVFCLFFIQQGVVAKCLVILCLLLEHSKGGPNRWFPWQTAHLCDPQGDLVKLPLPGLLPTSANCCLLGQVFKTAMLGASKFQYNSAVATGWWLP